MALDVLTVLRAIGRPHAYLQTIEDARLLPVPGKGRGLFTDRARAGGELVCRLDGQVVDCDSYPELLHGLEWNALSERLLLVRAVRTSYGYLNHSRTPNLLIGADGHQLLAARDIAALEELTLDYLAAPVPRAYVESEEGRFLLSIEGGPPRYR